MAMAMAMATVVGGDELGGAEYRYKVTMCTGLVVGDGPNNRGHELLGRWLLPDGQLSVAPASRFGTQGTDHPSGLVHCVFEFDVHPAGSRRTTVIKVVSHVGASMLEYLHSVVQLDNPLRTGIVKVCRLEH